MQRVGVLNGNNITYDKDLTASLLASLTAGVITGLSQSGSGAGSSITAGKALIECTRSNGEKILVYYENTASVAVDMSGTKKVYIALDQAKIDDGSNNQEDGTGIGTIQTGASYPADNYIPLYSVASGVATDARVSVKSKLARTGLTPYRLCLIDASGEETFLAFGSNGQALISGGPSVLPTWQSPTVNIVGLTEKVELDFDDAFLVYDVAGTANKKVKQENLISPDYGDGSDGNVTISTNTTLTRDMYYDNLTVNNTIVLDPAGYKIFVKTLLTLNGIIRRNGNAGNNGSGATGGTIGALLAQGTLGSYNAPSAGGNGVSGTLGSGTASATTANILNTFYTGAGTKGGKGGDNPSNSQTGGGGGTAGTNTAGVSYNKKIFKQLKAMLAGGLATILYNSLSGATGGGGGSLGSNGTGGGGGGGGGNGGIIAINAKTITISATGVIESKGGLGGNGNNGSHTSNFGNTAGGGGGGGGGNGGIIIIHCTTFTNSGNINVQGGNGGTGGNGSSGNTNTGGGGTGGKGGLGGFVFICGITITQGTITLTGGTGGAGGTNAGSGGGNGGTEGNGTNGSVIIAS